MLRIKFEYKDWNNNLKKVECKCQNVEEVKSIYCLNECQYKIKSIRKI